MRKLSDIKDLKPAPYNPRQITGSSADGLRASLARFGDISGIVYNQRTGHLVAGHQRVEQLRALGASLEQDELGYVVRCGDESFRVRLVDWDEGTEALANVTANNPAIAGSFSDNLDDVLSDLEETFSGEVLRELRLDTLFGEDDSVSSDDGVGRSDSDIEYSKKIDGPVYEPRGDKPSVSELFDTDKARSLIEQIDESSVGDEEKHYLRHAAYRHVRFRYDLAAEYYAHASAEMQRLMESSALVIPDFNRALELGFVRLTKGLAELYEKNKENESGND